MSDCCLVVAFYDGLRRDHQEALYKEYLEANKETLKSFKHNLSRIVFAISCDDITEPSIVECAEDGITYLYRPNINLSFGAWAHAMNEFEHDYYILSEDDYVFVKHNFDSILVEELEKSGAEYVVVWKKSQGILNPKEHREHMSTIGIMNKETAKKFKHYNDTVLGWQPFISMDKFTRTFDTIGTIEKEGFHPYWYGDTVFIYCPERKPNGWPQSADHNDPRIFSNTLSSCYQFYVKNKEKFNETK